MRTALLLTVATAFAGSVLIGLVQMPAWAHSHGSGWADEDGGTIEVGAEARTVQVARRSQGTAAGSSGRAVPVCQWEPVPDDHIVARRWAGDDDVVLFFKICPDEPREIVAVRRDGSGPVAPPVAAWERALEHLELPEPQVEVNPDEPVVHIETWLWIEGLRWETHSETATATGVTATVTATPRRVVWEMGNGDVVACDGPGTAYDSSLPEDSQSTDCSYTYRHTSAGRPGDVYVVTATIEWELVWTVVGAGGGGELPAGSTSTSVPVPVGEMQALNQ